MGSPARLPRESRKRPSPPRERSELLSRRDWLRRSAGLAVACCAAPRAGQAIGPIARTGTPKFLFSVAGYSYNRLLKGDNAPLTLMDFVRDCAAMGADAVEPTSYYFPTPVTPEYLAELKRQCFLLGLDISGTAVGNEFCHPGGPKRDQQLAHVRQWVDYAAQMGAPVIRIFSGAAQEGQTKAEAQRLAVEAIEASCHYAGTRGIMLALENHGGLTTTADDLLELTEAVQSPWFGVNLDTGNFHSRDVYGDLKRLAPYAVNVQVKVMIRPEGEPEQPADFHRLASILRESGYRGYVVLEYEEKEDPRAACPKWFAQLREAFAG